LLRALPIDRIKSTTPLDENGETGRGWQLQAADMIIVALSRSSGR